MAARLGRQVTFLFGDVSPATEILGVREKGITLNGEPIDITSDEDSGVRQLIDHTSAQDEVELSLSGVTKDTRLRNAWFNNLRTHNISLTYPNGDMISGRFFIINYQETEPYNDATTFQATLMSNGTITLTTA